MKPRFDYSSRDYSKLDAAWHTHQEASRDAQRPEAVIAESREQKLSKFGFHTDIQADVKGIASQFTHEYHVDVEKVYDTSRGATLGSGQWGVVKVVTKRTTGERFAMKSVNLKGMNAYNLSKLHREIEIQGKLAHPNICRLFESYWVDNDKVHIIMELCTGGELLQRLSSRARQQGTGLGEQTVATLVEKMLSAVLYCHHNGVVHRDIKLDNFVFESDSEDAELKLIDFGLAMTVAPGEESMRNVLGTPSYMAPELWAGIESGGAAEYDSSVDMWALGVVTYMLLSGTAPFHHKDKRVQSRLVRDNPLNFPLAQWKRVSNEAKDFVSRLLRKLPAERLSASEALKHTWIRRASTMRQGLSSAEELSKHQEIVDSLEAFSMADGLKKLALETIAFSTAPDTLEELRRIFQKIDVDGSGTISFKEFAEAMSMHPELSPEKVRRMFDHMDINRSGEVDYLEFLAATISTQKAAEKMSVKSAFAVIDRDYDGYINKADVMAALGADHSEASVDELLRRHGDAQGRIGVDGFRSLMFSTEGENLLSAINQKTSSRMSAAGSEEGASRRSWSYDSRHDPNDATDRPVGATASNTSFVPHRQRVTFDTRLDSSRVLGQFGPR